jgi:hypothetical protein
MCNLPRSREDRIAIHSDHSHTQRRPHCHSYRSVSPTSEQHLHLEPSPSSRLQPPHTMAHERGACTRHDPKIPSVVRTSNSPDSDLVSSSTRTACPQARSSSDEPNCANRVYCFFFARRNAERCNTCRKESDDSIVRVRITSPVTARGTCEFVKIVCSVSITLTNFRDRMA